MAGEIVHVELKSSDYDRTARFYGGLFGWRIEPLPEMGYMTFRPAGGPGGGFVKPEASQAPGCLAYLAVDDIDSKLTEIERAGGRTILGKMPVGDMGAMAIFADLDGNTVGLWQAAQMPAAAPAAAGVPAAAEPARRPRAGTGAKKRKATGKKPAPAKSGKRKAKRKAKSRR